MNNTIAKLAKYLVEAEHAKPDTAEIAARITIDAAERLDSKPLAEVIPLMRESYPSLFVQKRTAKVEEQSPSISGQYNPWSSASKNVTMQVKIMADNPALAAELKALAK